MTKASETVVAAGFDAFAETGLGDEHYTEWNSLACRRPENVNNGQVRLATRPQIAGTTRASLWAIHSKAHSQCDRLRRGDRETQEWVGQ